MTDMNEVVENQQKVDKLISQGDGDEQKKS